MLFRNFTLFIFFILGCGSFLLPSASGAGEEKKKPTPDLPFSKKPGAVFMVKNQEKWADTRDMPLMRKYIYDDSSQLPRLLDGPFFILKEAKEEQAFVIVFKIPEKIDSLGVDAPLLYEPTRGIFSLQEIISTSHKLDDAEIINVSNHEEGGKRYSYTTQKTYNEKTRKNDLLIDLRAQLPTKISVDKIDYITRSRGFITIATTDIETTHAAAGATDPKKINLILCIIYLKK